MKSSCIQSSVLPAAFLLVGGVAMPHDQSCSGSHSTSSASSSSARPTPAEKPKPKIAERKENQPDRIANTGQRNAGQKPQILREQNAASRNVDGTKHHARTQPGRGAP